MFRRTFLAALCLAAVSTVLALAQSPAKILAPTPPLGWNSWDAYGLTIDEADFKANVSVLAGIKQLGWKYAVIDEGWYMEDPFGGSVAKEKYIFDKYGRLIPAINRFPSAANGAGLKPLADWVHKQGLQFGIHLIRGIPRESVVANTPIAGSKFTAADAGDTSDVCPWDQGNYGVKDDAAGQAWYDSMIGLYASWGVDYFKVDCISSRPYKLSEIRQIAAAIKKSGRPIILSLSPGPAPFDHAAEFGQYAQMWRTSDDHWDVWHVDHKPPTGPGDSGEFPFGTRDAFARIFQWRTYFKPGNWPDDDMLPFGSLTPHPGWGEPRESRLTHDEERTELTLWAISRSPLILGANLTKLDDFTRSLITQKEVLQMNQTISQSHEIVTLPATFAHARVWIASKQGPKPDYLAVFNLDDKPVHLQAALAELASSLDSLQLVDVWDAANPKPSTELDVTLAPHASALYRVVGSNAPKHVKSK
jgi:hypothetical protein